MKKLSLLFAALLTATVMNLNATTVSNVKYIDDKGKEQTCASATVVNNSSSTWNAGWYVVNGADVKLTNGATCNGAVHLILADGAKLTVTTMVGEAGIAVNGESSTSLTIYGQAGQTGQLIATAELAGAGIGGGEGGASSNITINGGIVTAIGGVHAAGIGGGDGGAGSNITINGGTVTATGGDDAPGIGSGTSCSTAASNIFVNPSSILKAGSSANPTTEIAHTTITTDVASLLAGKRHVTVETPTGPDMHDFLYFVGLNGEDTVRLNKFADVAQYLPNLTATFEYSKDRINWKAYDTWATSASPANTYQGNAIPLTKGDTVFFRALGAKKDGKNATMSFNGNAVFQFAFGVDDQIAAGGNIMSLYDATCEQDSMTAYGFYFLFLKATQLVSAPKLLAKKMAESCYARMFQRCTSLTTAPALPATTLFKSCYQTMFAYCSSLTQAPELPLTTLAEACYNSMFSGCTSLTTAPALPATTLTLRCYMSMFTNCTSLTQAPELKAKTLAGQCYYSMFQGCTSLQVDTCADDKTCTGALLVAPSTGASNWNKNMFLNCKGTVTTPQLGGHYCMKGYKDMHDFLYFVGLNGNDTVRLNKNATNATNLAQLTATFEYSKDRINWTEYTWSNTDNKTGAAITLPNAGDTVFFRAKGTNGKNATVGTGKNAGFRLAFGADDQIAAGGNIMSLYDATCEQDTMTAYGFYNLFWNAKQLVSAPKFPAKKLAERCYSQMFFNCTSLTQAPELKATTLDILCYASMFCNCSSLQVDTCTGSCDGAVLEVPTVSGTAPTNWNQLMFYGCKGAYANNIQLGGHYCIKEYVEPDMHDFLYFTSLKADGTGTVKLDKSNAKLLTATFEYSKDRIEWLDYTWPDNSGQGGYAIALENAGDTVFFRAKGEQGKNATMSINPGALFIFAFGTNDSIAAGGNSMSLYDATCEQNSMTNYGFYYLFRDAKQLVSAPKLPATKLASYCYNSMFYNCKALTQAPALSADSLAPYCCQNMFYNCKALTQAPELKATKLASYCYNSMFYNCEALTQAPALPADSLASYCYNGMFYNCKALTQAPELKATKLAPYCCQGMFQECSSLTQAPDLKATKLASYCYNGMFSNCKALTQAPELKATTLADRCCYQMFNACNTLIQAPALPADSLAPLCYYGMFTDCKALTQAPELKATKLADKCYYQMFLNCTALTQAPELPATTLQSSCYSNMFEGCTSLTAAPALPATTLKNGCYNEMFKSCTALTQAPELKAKTLARECYQLMFCLCTSLQVDTLSGDCNGAELVVPDTATAPSNWNQNMFYGCKGTAANNIQLGGHYCIKEYIAPYTRKVTNGNFGTICLDRKIKDMEGVEGLFVPYEKTATMLYCEEVEMKDVVAGGAYIFKADSDVVVFTMEGEAVSAAVNNDHMIGWLAADSTLNAQFYTDHADYYLLANNEITKPTEDSQILKNRAFIDMNFSAPTAPARGRLVAFSLNGTDAATGVEQVAGGRLQVAEKCMVNGQFVIIRDGRKFNAQGQEL